MYFQFKTFVFFYRNKNFLKIVHCCTKTGIWKIFVFRWVTGFRSLAGAFFSGEMGKDMCIPTPSWLPYRVARGSARSRGSREAPNMGLHAGASLQRRTPWGWVGSVSWKSRFHSVYSQERQCHLEFLVWWQWTRHFENANTQFFVSHGLFFFFFRVMWIL